MSLLFSLCDRFLCELLVILRTSPHMNGNKKGLGQEVLHVN